MKVQLVSSEHQSGEIPFTGDRGLQFERLLNKVSLTRENFTYSGLNSAISGSVVVALGPEAVDYLLDRKGSLLEHRTLGCRGYIEWSDQFNCWVIPTYHPHWLEAGNWAKTGVFLGDVQRALEINVQGFTHRPPHTIEDPSPQEFESWCRALPEGGDLAFDIETPGKAKAAEDELDFEDATPIERVSFAGREAEGISVPWTADYIPAISHLLVAPRRYLVWNRSFDKPRLESNGIVFGGPVHDMMDAWHVLQPDLPKNINYVGSIFLPHYKRWKFEHLGRPAYYSAVDSAALFDLASAILAGLEDTKQTEYYHRYIHDITECDDRMVRPGIPVDREARIELSTKLDGDKRNALHALRNVIPDDLRKYKIYAKTPKLTDGLVTLETDVKTKVCQHCGAGEVTKTAHTSRKTLSRGVPNPCYGADISEESRRLRRYAKEIPFVPSNQQLLNYCRARNHQPVFAEPEPGKPTGFTFDEKAVEKLIARYPEDPLYPKIKAYKGPEKLLGYVGKVSEEGCLEGGWPTKNDRLYPIFTHSPATGRRACKQPNLQQVPRVDEDDPSTLLLRQIFKPEPGTAIVEIDYAAIEAVLVGYFAKDPWFTRLARLGVHDYLNSHILRSRGVIPEAASPDWSDSDLKEFFGELKEKFKNDRHRAKTVVYLSLFGGHPKKIYESDPTKFASIKQCAEIQSFLFDLFPKLLQWQWDVTEQAANDGFLRGTWGQCRRFYKVWEWSKTREGRWSKKPGKQAKEAMNFIIQHAASGILKNAVLITRDERPDIFEHLRLTIHDSLFGYLPLTQIEEMGASLESIMRRPIKSMPLDPSWNMGDYLRIGTEAKVGYTSWAEAKKAPWKLSD